MTMERLPFETRPFLGKISHQEIHRSSTRIPDHNLPQPVNQGENLISGVSGSSQSTKNRSESGSNFQVILQKLQKLDIPGKDHVEAYLRDKYRRNHRLSHIQRTLPIIAAFLKVVKEEGKKYLEQITRSDLGAYIEQEQDRGLKASTVKLRLDMLKTFIGYLIEKQIVSADILFNKMIIKIPQSLPKAVEIEDEKRLLSVIDNVRNRAIILLLLRTGMRIGELLNTQPQDIDLKEQKIRIWESEKNRMGRMVYFTDDAKDALMAWYKERDPERTYVFYASNRHTLSYSATRRMFCNYLTRAGLSHKGYTLHCLRHTNASSLLNAGMALECLKELLGHQSVEVTRRYARLTNKTRESEYFKAMEKIEKGEIDGYYKLDLELQKMVEEKKLFSPDGEKLHE